MKKNACINNSNISIGEFFAHRINLTNTNLSKNIIKKKVISQVFNNSIQVTCSNGTVINSNNSQVVNFTEYEDD